MVLYNKKTKKIIEVSCLYMFVSKKYGFVNRF